MLAEHVLAPPREIAKPLQAVKGVPSADAADVANLLGAAGGLREHFVAFERRPQQEQMSAAVAEALRKGNHLVVEKSASGAALKPALDAVFSAVAKPADYQPGRFQAAIGRLRQAAAAEFRDRP